MSSTKYTLILKRIVRNFKFVLFDSETLAKVKPTLNINICVINYKISELLKPKKKICKKFINFITKLKYNLLSI